MASMLIDPNATCCQPTCDEVEQIQVPGAPGNDGNDGDNGTDGTNAFTTIGGAGFTVPAEGATVSNVVVGSSAWMVVGQKVYVNTAGTFEVVATPTLTTVNLKNVENSASGLYIDNVAPGTPIAAGVKIGPSGLQGPGGAGAAGQLLAINNLSDVNNPATARSNLGLVIGTNVQGFDSDLAALAANGTNGLWARTAAGTGSARTITGTANQVTVVNGDGVAGNPTLSLPQNIHTGASPSFAGLTVATIVGLSSITGAITFHDSGILMPRVTGDFAADEVLTATQSFGVLTNQGAGGTVQLTLPGAAAGLQFTFIVAVNQVLRVRAAAGDTIRVAATVTGAGGGIETSTVGCSVTLVAIDTTNWVAIASVGAVWTFV